MSVGKLKYLNTQQLIKKKKITSIIVRVLVGLHAVCMTIVIVDSLGIAEWGSRLTLIPGLILISIALPWIYSLKRIKSEIKKRGMI